RPIGSKSKQVGNRAERYAQGGAAAGKGQSLRFHEMLMETAANEADAAEDGEPEGFLQLFRGGEAIAQLSEDENDSDPRSYAAKQYAGEQQKTVRTTRRQRDDWRLDHAEIDSSCLVVEVIGNLGRLAPLNKFGVVLP